MRFAEEATGGFGFELGCAVRGALDRVRMLVLLDHLDRARLALLRLDGPITVPEDTLLLRGRRGLTEKEHLEGARERTGRRGVCVRTGTA